MPREITVPTKPGRPEQAALNLPLRAPFIILSQQVHVDKHQSWAVFCESNKTRMTNVFDLNWGYVVYQQSESGGIEIAGYHYDTSD